MTHRLRTAAAASLLLLSSLTVSTVAAPAASADTQVCGDTESTTIQGGHYVVQNNKWNSAGAPQCITVTDTGFDITSGTQNVPTSGPPASYPSVFAGCHYGTCSTDSGLPLQISAFGSPHSSVKFHTTPGQWDAAYDIWFDPTPNPSGQAHGTEIMIWNNHTDSVQPAGQKVGTATLAGTGWDVWSGRLCGDGCWNVNSFVRQQPTDTLDVNLKEFTDDSVARGITDPSWYMTSVQFGFEPWQNGPGLGVESFSYSS